MIRYAPGALVRIFEKSFTCDGTGESSGHNLSIIGVYVPWECTLHVFIPLTRDENFSVAFTAGFLHVFIARKLNN